uniref:tRNA (Uracil-5-)-methyltransferase n=1 Tax=Mucochytrium quahogii TaxID=96639 RepID=A0A7S2SMC4_9STRA|mmetsp:Transcript_8304/g.18118  ORF Transcript_8304/g.18118 Transcript_8304/m.18118 type:complete len:410 (+) Transcript_8304:223-1452(+)
MVCECDICKRILDGIGQACDRDSVQRLKGFSIPVTEQAYQKQLDTKVEIEKEYWLKEKQAPCRVDIIDSMPLKHRVRIKFLFGQGEDGPAFGVCESPKYILYNLYRSDIATDRINHAMAVVLRATRENETLRQGLHLVNFVDTYGQDDFVIALYYTPPNQVFSPDSTWKASTRSEILAPLAERISGRIKVVAKMKKNKCVVGTDQGEQDEYLRETGLFGGKTLIQTEGSFSNPNPGVTQAVNEWLERTLKAHEITNAHLLELCSGCGNHTVGLAAFFQRVISVEIDHNLVKRAAVNIELNNIENVTLVNDDMKNINRILKRYPAAAKNAPTVVLVDPPRCGLDTKTASFIRDMSCDFLIYVACGDGLRENFSTLNSTYELVHLCIADHFPFTHFLEKIALFKRRIQTAT